MTKKLTPWFPANVKPVRAGIYIASMNRNTFYRHWNGRWWSYGSYFLADVQNNDGNVRRFKWPEQEQIRWRGLAKNPNSQ